ncbi:hypothetical protein BH23PLA1_BH23PLA1_37430 [soil metagenome]
MARGRWGAAARELRGLLQFGVVGNLSDGELVERYLTRSAEASEAAFEALVHRHGPMVLRVCKGAIGDAHEAQDAFQATFLILARRASAIRQRESLANWLHGVAVRVSTRARKHALRRRALEDRAVEIAESRPVVAGPAEPCPELHEEIARLPDRYRAPIVLCYLEGLTHEQAAARLGWPVGTVRGRLARARDLLRTRLTRRGLAPVVGALLGARQTLALAGPPAGLVAATVEIASKAGAGRLAMAGTVPASVAALSEGAVRIMFWSQVSKVGLGIAMLGALVIGVSTGATDDPSAKRGDAPRAATVEDHPIARGTPRHIPAEPEPENAKPESTFTRVYVVADLLNRSPDQKEGPIDFEPLIEIITTSVVPGTWNVQDDKGQSVAEGEPPIGSITPFWLNVSLIVKHNVEAHEEIVALLGRLRRLQAQWSSAEVEEVEERRNEKVIRGATFRFYLPQSFEREAHSEESLLKLLSLPDGKVEVQLALPAYQGTFSVQSTKDGWLRIQNLPSAKGSSSGTIETRKIELIAPPDPQE